MRGSPFVMLSLSKHRHQSCFRRCFDRLSMTKGTRAVTAENP
jgi:hypothetical protein